MNKVANWLFNPFEYLAGGKALALGAALLLCSAILAAVSGVRFDNVLQLNIGETTILNELFKLIINVACMVLLLWPAGKILSRSQFRFIDLLGTQMLARWPFQVFGLLLMSMPSVQNLLTELLQTVPFDIQNDLAKDYFALLIIIALASLLFACWTIYLMYKSFQVSCNVSGMKSVIAFTVVLIVADLASVLLIFHLPA